MSTNLKVTKGDTKSYVVEFTDSNDQPIPITGWTVYFIITKDTSTALITKTITSHTDAENGKTTVVLTSIDTNRLGEFYYDLRIKRGPTSEPETVISNSLIIFTPT